MQTVREKEKKKKKKKQIHIAASRLILTRQVNVRMKKKKIKMSLCASVVEFRFNSFGFFILFQFQQKATKKSNIYQATENFYAQLNNGNNIGHYYNTFCWINVVHSLYFIAIYLNRCMTCIE